MAWPDEIIPILRVMINDTSETSPTFSDERLSGAILVASRLVVQSLDFPATYQINVVNETIVPDPTEDETRDENFINLVSVKAACILDRGSAGLAASQAIMVQDGSSKVDLRDAFKAKLSLIEKGWCAVYDEMSEEYQFNQSGDGIGAAIMTPFRVYAGSYRTGFNRMWVR